MYLVVFTKQAEADKKLIKQAGLEAKARALIDIISQDPFETSPRYEKLVGNLKGNYSRRINIQHRLIYSVIENADNIKEASGNLYDGIVKIKRMWTHYGR